MLTVQMVGDKALIGRLDKMPTEVNTALLREVTAIALDLERYVKESKLSGQVLNVRTGALRSGIFHTVTNTQKSVIGTVSAPRDVPYAAIHEFGGTIHVPDIYPTTAKALHFFIKGREVFTKHVKAHDIKMPERSYLRSALADMREQIIQRLVTAVQAGLDA